MIQTSFNNAQNRDVFVNHSTLIAQQSIENKRCNRNKIMSQVAMTFGRKSGTHEQRLRDIDEISKICLSVDQASILCP